MPKIPRFLLLLTLAALLCTTAQAQTDYERNGFMVSTGAQYLNNLQSIYWTSKTYLTSRLDDKFGTNADISFGHNYISINPPWWMAETILAGAVLIIGDEAFDKHWGRDEVILLTVPFMLLTSPRFYYPFGKNFEVFAGWDTFKLTKMKDISSAWYLTGSLTAGINFYVNKYLYISGYYEFNHTHNPFTRSLNWALGGLGVNIPDQPKALNGHSVGIQIGYGLF